MDFLLKTRMEGVFALTDHFHDATELQAGRNLYKFMWQRKGLTDMSIDHVPVRLAANGLLALSTLHHVDRVHTEGECLTLLFNSNFYCIYGHDNAASCNGFLFHGSSHLPRFTLSGTEAERLGRIIRTIDEECAVRDHLQEEMLRTLLKHFIITCTRIACQRLECGNGQGNGADIVRRFYALVDKHFKEKKRVQDYAEMLCRSPKTLTNLFSLYGLASPLRIIHERIDAEARRLLLYTSKSAKEISEMLGFEDLATFSRFFRKMNGKSISDYRREG